MQGNILSGHIVILTSQVILLSDVTSLRAFHVQGNILSGYLSILPSQVIFTSVDVITVIAFAVVRIRFNKTIITLALATSTITFWCFFARFSYTERSVL